MVYYQATSAFLAAAFLLTGCSDDPNVSNQRRGAVGGAVAGAVIANQVSDDNAAPVLGAIAGGLIGGELGRQQDQRNQDQAAKTLNSTLAKASNTWVDDNDNTQYTFTVNQPYQNKDTTCRPYTLKRQVNGAASTKHGVACLTADRKAWKLA
ncbi:MAG: hypothetical protein CMF43_00810 [Legionellales bacterium]|nr:hypothetical protein [Legionellales bacterium]